jgi:HlyD family secretion protein
MRKYIIVLITSLVLWSCNSEAPLKDVVQGKVEREEIALVGKIAGRIQEIKVREGDVVHQGDTLAILDIPELSAKKAQANGALRSAEAQYDMTRKGATANQLKQLQAKKVALTEQYEFAKKSVNRLVEMVKDSLVPQQQYDEVYAKYQGAQAQLIAVGAEIADVQNGVRIEQQQMALGQQDRAVGALQEINVADVERYIIAPQDMVISNITMQVGELALPGYTLFKGNLPKSCYFRFTVPENKLINYKVGQDVSVAVVYNKAQIKGIIKNIKQIGAYANIASAYPDYDMQNMLYEVIVAPNDVAVTADLISKTTVILQ